MTNRNSDPALAALLRRNKNAVGKIADGFILQLIFGISGRNLPAKTSRICSRQPKTALTALFYLQDRRRRPQVNRIVRYFHADLAADIAKIRRDLRFSGRSGRKYPGLYAAISTGYLPNHLLRRDRHRHTASVNRPQFQLHRRPGKSLVSFRRHDQFRRLSGDLSRNHR